MTNEAALFKALKHGDAEHQAWLLEAITAFFAGQPPPPVRGSGNKEARIAELEAQVQSLTRPASTDDVAAVCPACKLPIQVDADGSPDDKISCDCTLVSVEWVRAAIAALATRPSVMGEVVEVLETARDTLAGISTWRKDSLAYTDSLDLPPRRMDESQIIHIEGEANRPLAKIDALLSKLRSSGNAD